MNGVSIIHTLNVRIKENDYDCGPFDIKFIDFDTLGASLLFSNNMLRYREILQYSITSVSYKHLGVHEQNIPIVDCIPDQLKHVPESDETIIIKDKNNDVYMVNIEEKCDDDTNNSSANRFSEDELTENWSVDFKYDMKMEVHNLILTSTSTLSTSNTNGI